MAALFPQDILGWHYKMKLIDGLRLQLLMGKLGILCNKNLEAMNRNGDKKKIYQNQELHDQSPDMLDRVICLS